MFFYISYLAAIFHISSIFFEQVTGMVGHFHIKPKVEVPITIGTTAFHDSFGSKQLNQQKNPIARNAKN